MKRDLQNSMSLWRHKPRRGVTTTVRSHFACFAARASLSSWNSSGNRTWFTSQARPSRHSYLVILRKPLIVEHHGYQATCPNGLLFHHPSGAVCRGQFEARNYLECLTCNSKTDGTIGSLRLLISTFARRALSRHANANIAHSHHVAARQNLPRTKVIFHGVEDPFTGKGMLPKRTSNAKGFAYLGRLVVEKGVSVLLEATRLLRAEGREVHVVLIGDGRQRPEIETQLRQNGLASCARITGYLTGAPLVEALRAASVVVMPSVWEETAGLAAIAQMMRGRR